MSPSLWSLRTNEHLPDGLQTNRTADERRDGVNQAAPSKNLKLIHEHTLEKHSVANSGIKITITLIQLLSLHLLL